MTEAKVLGFGICAVLGAGLFLLSACEKSTDTALHNGLTVDGVCLSQPLAIQEPPDQLCLTPDEIAGLRRRNVLRQESGRIASLTLTNPADETSSVTLSTCREYDILVQDGWYPETSLAMATEGIYVQTCAVLAELETAQPAEEGNLPDVGELFDDLSLLPFAMLPSFQPLEEEAGSADVHTSVAGALAKGDARLIEQGEVLLRLSTPSATVSMQETARGDFTGDGSEDVLLAVSARATGGTAQMTQLILLESYGAGDLFSFEMR